MLRVSIRSSTVQSVVGQESVDAMSEDKIQAELAKVVDIAEKKSRYSPRKQRFIKELQKDPSNPALAAKIAGYSEKSARWTARRLLEDPLVQQELAAHFVDHEEELTDILGHSLLRLYAIIVKSNDAKFLRAFDKVVAYTKIAVGVLGLTPEMQKRKPAPTDSRDPRDLIEQHRREIERLERLAGGPEGIPSQTGETEIQ